VRSLARIMPPNQEAASRSSIGDFCEAASLTWASIMLE